MTAYKVPLLNFSVRRDANTITPVSVPQHEATILRSIFGKENVIEHGDAGTVKLDAAEEHARLCAKYGDPVVEGIYGQDGGERLAELVERHAIKPKANEKPPE